MPQSAASFAEKESAGRASVWKEHLQRMGFKRDNHGFAGIRRASSLSRAKISDAHVDAVKVSQSYGWAQERSF